jgi:hypothetical protein
MVADGSPEYLALLEPPYNPEHPLMDRPLLDDGGRLYYLKDVPRGEQKPRWPGVRRIESRL